MQILGLSTALPKSSFSTEKLLETFPCELPGGVKENILNLGVSKRHLLDYPKSEGLLSEKGLVELCSKAAENALRRAGLSIGKIGCLISAYDVNPFLSPGLSQLLVPTLGLDRYTSLVNLQGIASTAFPKALELAKNHLVAHPDDKVLICVSGVSSYWFQNQVRGLENIMEISTIATLADKSKRQLELQKWVATMQFFLFGDGVSTAIATSGNEGLTVGNIAEVTNIGESDYLAGCSRLSALNEPFRFGFFSHLDRQIPNLGVKYTALALERLLGEKAQATMKAARKWAVHTGSEKILNALAERNCIEAEKLKESHEVLREYGNLAGASLPFILEKIVSTGKLVEGDIVLMLGYGWGFSASASMLRFGN